MLDNHGTTYSTVLDIWRIAVQTRIVGQVSHMVGDRPSLVRFKMFFLRSYLR